MGDNKRFFSMDIKPPKSNKPQPQSTPSDGLIMPEPETTPAPEVKPESIPVTTTPEPEVEPAPEPEADPLFTPVSEPDPIQAVPVTVAPTPAPAVTTQVINKLDDKPRPVVVGTGQTVVATSEPHKSRRKVILMLVIGLLLLAGIGFAVYTYFVKPKAPTAVPAVIVSVDKLQPENLTQATDKAELEAGSQTNAATILLSGEAPADAAAGLSLEVEIQPLGTDFTGTPTDTTIAAPDEDNPLQVKLTDYPAGSYHWQARLTDGSKQGPWTPFATKTDATGEDEAAKTADFTVDRTAPAAALIKTVNGRTVSTKTVTSSVAQPVLTGTAEAGSAITVAFGTAATYKATATAEGTWTLTAEAAVPNARYDLVVTSTDSAGNATATTYTLTQSAR